MSDWKKLPKFGDATVRTRTCNYALTPEFPTDENACARGAIAHVIWTATPEAGSFMCERHVGGVLDWFRCHSFHPMGPSCGMPGARFYPEENTCRVEGEELPVAVDEELEVSA